jgi:hypothetical protein
MRKAAIVRDRGARTGSASLTDPQKVEFVIVDKP